jgi:hypothetical protein
LRCKRFGLRSIMFDDTDDGVVIADGRSGVRLCCVGKANELGYPTLIEVQAGPFTGSVRDDTVGNYSTFLEQLESLYNQLSGTAELGSYEGFRLALVGGGGGGISVSAVIIGEHVPSIRLTFEFSFDQSYLPPIIRGIRREFPAPTRVHDS